jgi:hypothetical protein
MFLLKPEYNMMAGGLGGDTSHTEAYKAGMAQRDFNGSRNPMSGKYGENNPNYGKQRSAEQKERLRQGLQKSWDGNNDRREKASLKVLGYENNPGAQKSAKKIDFEGIVYHSIAEASRQTGRCVEYIRKKGIIISA